MDEAIGSSEVPLTIDIVEGSAVVGDILLVHIEVEALYSLSMLS